MSKYIVKHLPKSVVEVEMNISVSDIEGAYTKARKAISTRTQLPGFRKGKAPEAMIDSYVGKEKIYEEALNKLLPEEFENALKEDQKDTNARTVVLTYPDFKLENEWKPGAELKVKASCVIYPRFNIDKLDKDLRVKKDKAEEVTEAEVEESVEKIFEQYKKIKKQDKIKLEDLKDVKPEDVEVDVQKDDEFAKAAGAQTLDELKKMIKSEIEYDKTLKVEREFEDKVVKKAQELVDIDIPDILVEEELNRIEQRFTGQLTRIGTTFEKYLETEKKDKDAVRKEWQERALENTKLALILQEVRVKDQLKVEEQEIQSLAAQNGIKTGMTQDQYNTLSYIIGQSKALDMLKVKAAQE
jgi:FKBP-type peptidyl-prolyl cis-trans isomerase (trigger factor)